VKKCSREISQPGNVLKPNVSDIRSISIIGIGENTTLMMEAEKVLEILVIAQNYYHFHCLCEKCEKVFLGDKSGRE
jgi:hypothetical protein